MTMPRRRDVLLPAVLEYVQRRRCVLTADVARLFNISDDRAYHMLQALQASGEVCAIKAGGLNIWCARGAEDVDPFAAAVPCLGKVRDVLEDIAKSGKGGVVSVSSTAVAGAVAKRCGVPPSYVLQTAVRSYLPLLLAAAGIPYTSRAKTIYIVPRGRLLNLGGIAKIPVAPRCAKRRPPGRGSGMAVVTFKLPYSLLDELTRLASQLGIHRSDVIRRAIEAYLRARNAAAQPMQADGEAKASEDEDFPVIRGRI